MGGSGVIMAPVGFNGQVCTFPSHAQWYKEEERRVWMGRAVMENSGLIYCKIATRAQENADTLQFAYIGKVLLSSNSIF